MLEGTMSMDTINKLNEELMPGEKLIWSGQPQQGFLLRGADIFMIPLSLIWLWFAILWESLVISGLIYAKQTILIIFVLLGIPFVLLGLYTVFGRFIVDKAQRKKTYYGLTDHRILIITGLNSQNHRALLIKNIPEINLQIQKEGKGTILFGQANYFYWMSPVNWFFDLGLSKNPPKFEMINDAKMVYDQIIHLQKNESV
jgi:hypothetical protein